MRPAKGGQPCFDFGLGSVKVLWEGRGLELPLERKPDGTLTDDCRQRVAEGLRRFLGTGERGAVPASCGVAARGVSLRRIDIPPVGRDEVPRILALQVEKEFPLSLEQLAWGYLLDGEPTNGAAPAGNGAARSLRAIVAAVRRNVLDDYGRLLSGCGIRPVFIPGALAAAATCAAGQGAAMVLDIGRTHSEVLTLEDGRPTAVRSLPWGAGDLEVAPAAPPGEAGEVLPPPLPAAGAADAGPSQDVPPAIAAAAGVLVRMVRELLPRQPDGSRLPLFLTGGGSRHPDLARAIAKASATGSPARW